MRAFIGLGSNVGDGRAQLLAALECVGRLPGIKVLRCSSLYRTAAWGIENQPDFTNAVAELETGLSPGELLAALLTAEQQLGRQRSGHQWGERTIDLDLLCYEQVTMKEADLELPHPQMHLRAFVLVPLTELVPDFVIPGVGAARQCLENLGCQRVERLS